MPTAEPPAGSTAVAPPTPRTAPRRLALLGWGVVAVLVSAWLSLVEVFWVPLRLGGVLVPLSVAAAVAGNLLLPALALRRTGSRAVAVLPVVVWLGVAYSASVRRAEGDLVLVGGGALGAVALAFLLLGVVAGAFAAGRVLARRPPSSSAGGQPQRRG